MSWLSDLTHIHIGSGPKPVDFQPPPQVASNPQALAKWNELMAKVNGTITQADRMNIAAEALASAGIGGEALGALGVSGGAASTAGGVVNSTSPAGPDGSGDTSGSGINLGSILGDIGGFLKNNGTSLLSGGLTAASALNAYERQKASDKYAQEALNGLPNSPGSGAIAEFNANAPLRAAGRAGLLNPSAGTPDLSNLRTLAGSGSGNPFAKALPMANLTPSAAPSIAGPTAAPLPVAPNIPVTPGSAPLPGQPGLPPGATNGLPPALPPAPPITVGAPPSSLHGLPVAPKALPPAPPITPQVNNRLILPMAGAA